ncbi:Heparinase II/III-like protein [Microlunatus soli]|uniref:Heparinase II/III-like protein n=1 Tax=Microlunatus soli TaxID=630515 RepID=A0A1H1RIM7_9ACTN|nr:Heparinase II/III-like protein [Microlunatus soli]
MRRSTEPDWDLVRRRVEQQTWATKIISTVHDETEEWRRQLRIPGPERQSAWTHFYYCDDDGERLTFDPRQPNEHRCPACDRVYSGDPKDGSWRTLMHNQAAAQAQRDAVIMRVAPGTDQAAAARAELEMIITGYGEHYTEYVEHGGHAGIGKVLPQCLDEAIWAIGLLRATRWTADQLDGRALAAADLLARGVNDLLQPQVGAIHNIHCWMLAALAECANRLDDPEVLDFTCGSQFGAIAQLRQGFRADGLWFEINPHYHYYTVSALLAWLEAVGADQVDPAVGEILGRAMEAPPRLAYSDGLLPAYGDGWADARVSRFAGVAETASRLLPDRSVALADYYVEGQERDSLPALLFGPDHVPTMSPHATTSFCWADAGIAVLRSADARIALRSGPHAGGHDHRDKLAVDVETATGWRSLDLGTSGYGAEFTVWLRSPAAHSTVFIGGGPQPACNGRISEFDAGRAVGEVGWDGHRLRREITLTEGGWTDAVSVELDGEDEISWLLHGDGTVTTDCSTAPTTAPEALSGLGIPWLSDMHSIAVDHDQLNVSWDAPGAPSAMITIPPGFVACTATGEGNPSGLPLGTVLITGRATTAEISARFTV